MDSGFHVCEFGFHIHGFRIPLPTTWILDYNYGWIPDPISWFPDSKAMDSGFHRPKLPGLRIPDYLTWGELCLMLQIKCYAQNYPGIIQQTLVVSFSFVFHETIIFGKWNIIKFSLQKLDFLLGRHNFFCRHNGSILFLVSI